MGSRTGYCEVEGSGQGVASHELQLRDLPSKRLLGEGLAGIGYETEWEGKKCARKDFVGVPSGLFREEASKLVVLEDHKNIVKTYGWTVDKRSCSLVLELMDDDLVGFLQKRKEYKRKLASEIGSGTQHDPSDSRPFKLVEALNVIMEIAKGMKQLHDRGIAHRDLKTRNILVNFTNDLGVTNSLSVKVADFGLVRTKRKSIFFISRQVRKLDMVQWKSPEYLRKLISLGKLEDEEETSSESDSNSDENTSPRSGADTDPLKSHDVFAADVYSFAVICSHILTGEDPYPNLNWKMLVDKILDSGLKPKVLEEWPPPLKEFLQSCWDEEPRRRPSFSDIPTRLQAMLRDLSQDGCNDVGEDVITRDEMEAGPHEALTHLEAVDEIQTALELLSVSQRNKRESIFGEELDVSDAEESDLSDAEEGINLLEVSPRYSSEPEQGHGSEPDIKSKAASQWRLLRRQASVMSETEFQKWAGNTAHDLSSSAATTWGKSRGEASSSAGTAWLESGRDPSSSTGDYLGPNTSAPWIPMGSFDPPPSYVSAYLDTENTDEYADTMSEWLQLNKQMKAQGNLSPPHLGNPSISAPIAAMGTETMGNMDTKDTGDSSAIQPRPEDRLRWFRRFFDVGAEETLTTGAPRKFGSIVHIISAWRKFSRLLWTRGLERSAPGQVTAASTRSVGIGANRSQLYKGVRKRNGKWVSEIRVGQTNEKVWLGSYDTEKEAALAFDAGKYYCSAKRCSSFNFPDSPRLLGPPINLNDLTRQDRRETIRRLAEYHAKTYASAV